MHKSPYYGGEKFARTLDEAFGPHTSHVIHPTTRRGNWLRRFVRWTFAFAFALAAVIAVGEML